MPLPTNPEERKKAARAALALLRLSPEQRGRMLARHKMQQASRSKAKPKPKA